MFKYATPESVGISSSEVLDFIKTLDDYNLFTHSIIMARGDKVFTEVYYAPFTADFKHRMYSVSKSFVSVAVGLLIEDGLLSLDDKFVKFFPEYADRNRNEFRDNMTIRDMLVMETCNIDGVNWFTSGTTDRNEVYFKKPGERHSGMIFRYDSPGSYMLCVIVEKLAGKPFMEFLKERILLKTGFSSDAYCIKVPGGYSFGDSGVMCTSMDLLRFARFVMNYGTWDGERLMNAEYLKDATKRQVSNDPAGHVGYNTYGYGYQIWKAPDDGFAFIGMGDQFAICDPAHDFIFVINSDNQGNPASRTVLYHELYKSIIHRFSDEALPENPGKFKELCEYLSTRKLAGVIGEAHKPCENEVNGAVFKLDSNPMNIEYVSFDFKGEKGVLSYKNAQGEKKMVFGLGYNEFGKFPEEGYADITATIGVPGNKYDCAFSGAWVEDRKLAVRAQVIDKYFGNLQMTFSFKDDCIAIQMAKTAQAFMNEYSGFANGKRI